MVEDHAQVGHGVRQPQDVAQDAHAWVGQVERQAARGELLQVGDELAAEHLVAQVAVPQVATADAQKQRIFAEAIEVLREARLARLQVAHRADHQRVLLDRVQHPLVVFEPGAGLDLDGPDDGQVADRLAQPLGQRLLVNQRVRLRRPGHALGPRGVVQVDVGVDNRRLVDLGQGVGARRGQGGGRLEEFASAHPLNIPPLPAAAS